MTALLVKTIATRLGVAFKEYDIIPLGSQTKIIKKKDSSIYELFGERDLSIIKFFWYRRFDTAMTAFLKCVKEIQDFILERDPKFTPPYKIDAKDPKIEELSTKLQFNHDQVWTRALKYMLTNVKWILVWLAQHHR
eukprot:TRINITY_DN2603_c0_g1_i2.p1 TRINITY_DN2603_c0_g1~~TRINITY_DN2603_c0_g1_i2.p1  ORF type:complete len:136 (-),score=16.86 TRINITY_DN2603_c0_g1_i2:34-441(-)